MSFLLTILSSPCPVYITRLALPLQLIVIRKPGIEQNQTRHFVYEERQPKLMRINQKFIT